MNDDLISRDDLRKALESLPRSIINISGQSFSYVQLGEVSALVLVQPGAPSVATDREKQMERQRDEARHALDLCQAEGNRITAMLAEETQARVKALADELDKMCQALHAEGDAHLKTKQDLAELRSSCAHFSAHNKALSETTRRVIDEKEMLRKAIIGMEADHRAALSAAGDQGYTNGFRDAGGKPALTGDEAQELKELRAGRDAALDEIASLRRWLKDAEERAENVTRGPITLDGSLNHRLLDVFREGERAREHGGKSHYGGHTLEHCLHACGWVSRDLRLALDAANSRIKSLEQQIELSAPLFIRRQLEERIKHLEAAMKQADAAVKRADAGIWVRKKPIAAPHTWADGEGGEA